MMTKRQLKLTAIFLLLLGSVAFLAFVTSERMGVFNNVRYAIADGWACDGVTDDGPAWNASMAALSTTSNGVGGEIILPNKTCLIASQVTVPNDGQNPPHQVSIKITGTGGGGLTQQGTQSCNGGSILNMTFNATTAKILTLGQGALEITGICFKDTNTDFKPFLLDTNTVLQFHHNYCQGNTSHFASPPTQNGQDCIILGGLGTVYDGTV